MSREIKCHPREGGFTITFDSMASPCEVLVDESNPSKALTVGKAVANEAWRIEDKYSRYRQDSVCGQINANAGRRQKIDDETFRLLKFAEQCYQMSEGLFDITSGILRRVWHFDGSDNIPAPKAVQQLLPLIGFERVKFDHQTMRMSEGMELDFGGLGKEYAVDRAVAIATQLTDNPILVNFGGDIAVSGARANNQAWQVGVEHPSFVKQEKVLVEIRNGAIATSGDANRFLLKDGVRYGHVLNVTTGWPVKNPPHALTVAAPKCIQAGFLATLGLLQGENAEAFLREQDIQFWAIR